MGRRLRNMTDITENQFEFILGRSTIEALSTLRQIMEKYKEW